MKTCLKANEKFGQVFGKGEVQDNFTFKALEISILIC